METKVIDAVKVIKFSTKATLKSLNQFTGVMPDKLMKKANELGVADGWPQIWQYSGSDGRPDTEFQLDICVPVTSFDGDPGEFSFCELPAVRCLSEMHCGAWMEMGRTYQVMMEEIAKKSIGFTGVSREIYINCDFKNQQNCVTELQIVLKD